MRALIDTCVIIDALADRKPWGDDARHLITLSMSRKVDGCISAKSIVDIHYIIKKYLHNESDTRNKLVLLLSALTSVDTKGVECSLALSSPMADYEDAVQIETAINNRCDYIVTRNLKDYKGSPIKAIGPEDFLKLIK